MKNNTVRLPSIGSVSHGTLRTEDLLPDFVSLLRELGYRGKRNGAYDRASRIANLSARHGEIPEGLREEADELVNDLCDLLDGFAPEFCYFGTHPGDGSDFGFWASENWRELAEDDGCPIVSDGSELPEGFANGPWFQMSDHGNLALYFRTGGADSEVWATV